MKHIIPILIVLLLLSSGFVGVSNTADESIVDTETMGRDEFLDDLAFYCLDASGSNAKYEYYKEKLLKDCSNDDIAVIEDNNNHFDVCYSRDTNKFVLVNIIEDIDGNLGLEDSLYVDEDFIWAGTYNGSVYMYDREDYSPIHKIQPFDYIAGIKGDNSYVYILGKIHGNEAATYIFKYERNSMNLIEQSDSLPEGYGFWCITKDENFIYIGEKSIAVDDKYLFHSCLNPNYPALIYNKQLLLMEQLPSQPGLSIFDKENLSLVKFIQYDQSNQIPNIYSDDDYLYTAHQNGSVYVYEKNNFTVIETLFRAGQDYANTASSDSLYIYVGREAFKINVYDKNTFEYITDLNSSGYLSEFRTISPFDNYIYAGTSLIPKIFIYRYETPPNAPTIDGPTSGNVGVTYYYNFTINDIDGDPMYLWVDWDDGTQGPYVGPYESGIVILGHTWSEKGNYTIRAKTKDVYGEESDWAYLEVTMPKNQNMWFLRWLERFPILQKILDVLRLNN